METSRTNRWERVIAQLVVAVAIMVLSEMIGASRFQALNTVLAIFGFFSLFVAAFNLIPAPPLDGAVAWGLVPALLKCFLRTRNTKREADWRS
jgi:Zn-dependent protease